MLECMTVELEKPGNLRIPGFQYLTLYHVSQETRWHQHAHAEVGYVLTGSLNLFLKSRKFKSPIVLSKDCLFKVTSGIIHKESPLGSRGAEVLYLGATISDRNDDQSFETWNLPGQNPVKTILQNLVEARERKFTHAYARLSTALVFETIKRLREPASTDAEDPETSAFFLRTQGFIGGHFSQTNFGPQALAKGMGISLRTLQLAFKKHRGMTPVEAITLVRLNRARELLAFTRESIPVISRLCGFSSPGYFMRAFRKGCGMTASAYRKRHAPRAGAPQKNFSFPSPEDIKRAME